MIILRRRNSNLALETYKGEDDSLLCFTATSAIVTCAVRSINNYSAHCALNGARQKLIKGVVKIGVVLKRRGRASREEGENPQKDGKFF